MVLTSDQQCPHPQGRWLLDRQQLHRRQRRPRRGFGPKGGSQHGRRARRSRCPVQHAALKSSVLSSWEACKLAKVCAVLDIPRQFNLGLPMCHDGRKDAMYDAYVDNVYSMFQPPSSSAVTITPTRVISSSRSPAQTPPSPPPSSSPTPSAESHPQTRTGNACPSPPP